MIKANHEYHILELTRQVPFEMWEWLEDNMGPPGERWFVRQFTKIYFENAKDHMMCLVRWS